MAQVRVLLLEDDAALRTVIAGVLRAQGVAVDEAGRVSEADEKLSVNDYDLAVLDRMLPDGDSAQMLARLRGADVNVPVIFLTAMADVTDRVHGLDAGGDDYLVKPFAMEELLARIRSLARRPAAVTMPELELADLVIDPARTAVSRGSRRLTLTPKEYAVLEYLVRHTGRVVSRSELLEHCWDEYADPTSNVVDVRMRLLRNKLGDPPLVHTVRGVGYIAEERIPDEEDASLGSRRVTRDPRGR